MSSDQLKGLIAAVASNRDLANRFSKVSTSQEAAQVAALIGFEVTAEEIEAAGRRSGGELSEAELAGVAGGGSPSLDPMLCPTGQCQSLYGLGCG
jgi:predicted ribosomally synthesized peptide with nif11-like leader